MFDSSSAKSGEDHTVNFKPEPGYYVGKVVVDGVGRDDLKDAGSIQFKGVASDHTESSLIFLLPSEEERERFPRLPKLRPEQTKKYSGI